MNIHGERYATMQYDIAFMKMSHYDDVYRLWQASEGVGLSSADSRESIETFLLKNDGLSFVAVHRGEIIGAVLGSHDGRRGYIHHLTVDGRFRRNGVGRALAVQCLNRFRRLGLRKTHVFVFRDNDNAIGFWKRMNYSMRDDLFVMSLEID